MDSQQVFFEAIDPKAFFKAWVFALTADGKPLAVHPTKEDNIPLPRGFKLTDYDGYLAAGGEPIAEFERK